MPKIRSGNRWGASWMHLKEYCTKFSEKCWLLVLLPRLTLRIFIADIHSGQELSLPVRSFNTPYKRLGTEEGTPVRSVDSKGSIGIRKAEDAELFFQKSKYLCLLSKVSFKLKTLRVISKLSDIW